MNERLSGTPREGEPTARFAGHSNNPSAAFHQRLPRTDCRAQSQPRSWPWRQIQRLGICVVLCAVAFQPLSAAPPEKTTSPTVTGAHQGGRQGRDRPQGHHDADQPQAAEAMAEHRGSTSDVPQGHRSQAAVANGHRHPRRGTDSLPAGASRHRHEVLPQGKPQPGPASRRPRDCGNSTGAEARSTKAT